MLTLRGLQCSDDLGLQDGWEKEGGEALGRGGAGVVERLQE